MLLATTFIQIFLAIYGAYLINQFVEGLKNPETLFGFDFNFITAIQSFPENRGVRLWFIALEFAYVYLLFTILWRPQAGLGATNEIHVTDKVKIPKAVGNGQHGNARFSGEKEKQEFSETFKFTGPEIPDFTAGVVIEMMKKHGTEHIRCVRQRVHTLIIGATGFGKSRRILIPTICMQLLTGVSVVATDVKGELYYFTHGFAKQLGYQCIVFDLRNPRKGMHYNFLQQIKDAIAEEDIPKAIDYTWDLVSVLVGERKGEPLWYNGETSTIAAAILAVCLEAPKDCQNLPNVYYFLAYMCQRHPETGETPLGLYLKTLPDNHPAKSVFAIAEVAEHRTKASFFTSALATLRLTTNPNIAEMCSKSDFSLKDIGCQKTIVYMIVPDEKQTFYPLASILIQQIYIALVEVANGNGLKLPVPTDFDLDEVGNFPTIPILSGLLSAGRSRGIRGNLVVQDYQQLEKKYKDDFDTIKSSCRSKIYLKTDNLKTLKEISETLGDYTVEAKASSVSTNTKRDMDNANVSSSSNMTGRRLLTAEELSRIDDPYALLMLTGEHPSIVRLPDLSQYKFNQLLGLGDEAHNTRLMERLESEREERPHVQDDDIPLWGIWEKYKKQLESAAVKKSISFLK